MSAQHAGHGRRIPAMTVTPISPPEPYGCRCDGDGRHVLSLSCYTPGRAPDSDGPGRFLSPWDLQGRLDEAREEGRAEGEAEAVAYALRLIRPVPLSLPVRRALAEALDVDPDDVGTATPPRTRKATP